MKIFEKLKAIKELKDKLKETDYRIIKCYEYSLAGKELPYDITELHSLRQEIRDKINAVRNGTENTETE